MRLFEQGFREGRRGKCAIGELSETFLSVCLHGGAFLLGGLFLLPLVVEHELLLILCQKLAGPLLVEEELVDLFDILHGHARALSLLGHQISDGNELDRVPADDEQ